MIRRCTHMSTPLYYLVPSSFRNLNSRRRRHHRLELDKSNSLVQSITVACRDVLTPSTPHSPITSHLQRLLSSEVRNKRHPVSPLGRLVQSRKTDRMRMKRTISRYFATCRMNRKPLRSSEFERESQGPLHLLLSLFLYIPLPRQRRHHFVTKNGCPFNKLSLVALIFIFMQVCIDPNEHCLYHANNSDKS